MPVEKRHFKRLREMCHTELQHMHIFLVIFLRDTDRLIRDLENNWNSSIASMVCDNYFHIIESAIALNQQLVQRTLKAVASMESKDQEPADSTDSRSKEIEQNQLELVDNNTQMLKDESIEEELICSTSSTTTSSLVGVAAILPLSYRPKDLSAYSVGTYLFGHVTYVYDIDNFTFYVNDIQCANEVQLQQPDIVEDWQKYTDMPDDGTIFAIVEENLSMRANRSGKGRAFLLDFGEEIDVNDNHLMYCLPNTLQEAPPQAIFCQLVDGTKNLEEKRKHLYLLAYKQNKFLVVSNNGEMLQLKWLPEKEISFEEESSEASMNPFLNVLDSKLFPSSGKSHLMPELIIHNGLDADDLEINEEPLATESSDSMGCCQSFKKKKSSLMLSYTQIPMVQFKIGVIINIIPTYIGQLNHFYAQINSSKETFTPLIWTNEDVPDWCHLKQLPLVYDIILARYEDGLWYRASVLDINNENKMATVFFIDYGNRQKVALRDMAKCDISISQLAHQAVVCYLDGVKELANITKEKREFGLSFLRSMILNQNVDARVVEHHGNLVVRFVNQNLLSSLNSLVNLKCVEPFSTKVNKIRKV